MGNAEKVFRLAPPHVALCAIVRLFVVDFEGKSDLKSTAKLVRFCIKVRLETSLKLPSLAWLMDGVQSSLEDENVARELREKLSGMTTVGALSDFFSKLKTEIDKPFASPLVKPFLPELEEPQKLPPYCPLALFLRECLVSFADMRLEEIARLATGMAEYCPAMMDQEQGSSFPSDEALMQRHLHVLEKGLAKGHLPKNLDAKLKDIESARKEDPYVLLLRHEAAIVRKDFEDAKDTLNRYCSYMHVDVDTSVDTFPETQRIHDMCMKLAALHAAFDQFQGYHSAVNDAFASAKKHGDDRALLNCYALLVRFLLQSPEAAESPTPIKDLDRWIGYCCEKSMQLKMPHLHAFGLLARAMFALRHSLVDGKNANDAEVHRLISSCERSLRQLRDYVNAAAGVSKIRQHPINQPHQTDISSQRLFINALKILDASLDAASLVSMMEETLAGAQLCLAQSWRRLGRLGLSMVSALSIEVTFRGAQLDDRVSALSHVVIAQAELKGPTKGADILSVSNKIEDMKEHPGLLLVQKYLCLMESSQQLETESHPSLWRTTDLAMQDLLSSLAHYSPVFPEFLIANEHLIIEALMAMNKHEAAREKIGFLRDLCETKKLVGSCIEAELLAGRLDDRLGTLHLQRSFLQTAVNGQRGASTVLTVQATVLYCRGLLRSLPGAADRVVEMLTAALPFAVSECPLRLQADVLMLLFECLCLSDSAELTTVVSIAQKAITISASMGRWKRVRRLCLAVDVLLRHPILIPHRSGYIRTVEERCRKHGLEEAGLSFRSDIWNDAVEDLMDLD